MSLWSQLKPPLLAASVAALNASSFALVTDSPSETPEMLGDNPQGSPTKLNEALRSTRFPTAGFSHWERIGRVGLGGGVHLGGGYVLTSAHVGCFPFVAYDGTVYQPEYATWRTLKNKDGTEGDLATFKLKLKAGDALSVQENLFVGDWREAVGSQIVLLGVGYTQGTPITISSNGNVLRKIGYRVLPKRDQRWGLSTLAHQEREEITPNRHRVTTCFSTTFSNDPFCAQAVEGDSGGAAFAFNRARQQWELIGCIVAIQGGRSGVLFGSKTYLADLSSYADQIRTR